MRPLAFKLFNQAWWRAGELVTQHKDSASQKLGRVNDNGIMGLVDPSCRMIALHIYNGIVKVRCLVKMYASSIMGTFWGDGEARCCPAPKHPALKVYLYCLRGVGQGVDKIYREWQIRPLKSINSLLRVWALEEGGLRSIWSVPADNIYDTRFFAFYR